ncbi:MAG: hypothetical protein ACE5IK_02025 [Acidobacteriota bacterium]
MTPAALIALVVWPVAPSPALDPVEDPVRAPARIALSVEFLGVDAGTRSLARHREVLTVGMRVSVDQGVSRQTPAGPVDSECHLILDTDGLPEGAISVRLRSRVSEPGGAGWERDRHLILAPGTSALVEIVPAEAGGERVVVSVTARPAGDEAVTVEPQIVEIDAAVYVVDGDAESLLRRYRLRTVTDRPATFSFDHPVPSFLPGQVDHVRFTVSITPRFARQNRLPIVVEVEGELPGQPDPLPVHRSETTALWAGQPWRVPISGDASPGLRLGISAVWRAAAPGVRGRF